MACPDTVKGIFFIRTGVLYAHAVDGPAYIFTGIQLILIFLFFWSKLDYPSSILQCRPVGNKFHRRGSAQTTIFIASKYVISVPCWRFFFFFFLSRHPFITPVPSFNRAEIEKNIYICMCTYNYNIVVV